VVVVEIQPQWRKKDTEVEGLEQEVASMASPVLVLAVVCLNDQKIIVGVNSFSAH
jgi:hypothetical protein